MSLIVTALSSGGVCAVLGAVVMAIANRSKTKNDAAHTIAVAGTAISAESREVADDLRSDNKILRAEVAELRARCDAADARLRRLVDLLDATVPGLVEAGHEEIVARVRDELAEVRP